MRCWADVEAFVVAQAEADLAAGADVRPCLVAFRADAPLFVAFLRPFPKGEYADPLVEVLAVAAPLGADRLAVSMAARAWSLEDPIPPVAEGLGDLRQRVLVVTTADGTGQDVRVGSAVHPFAQRGGRVQWHPVLREPGQGWIISALRLAVEGRRELGASRAEIRAQVARCLQLGHQMGFADEAARHLGLDEAARRA